MASSESFLVHVLDLLSGLDQVRYRKMMGEYILYHYDRVIGGIYDDRFLIKPTPTARRLLPAAGLVEPYPGASPMLMVEIEDRDQIARVVSGVAAEVPQTRGRSRRG